MQAAVVVLLLATTKGNLAAAGVALVLWVVLSFPAVFSFCLMILAFAAMWHLIWLR